MSQKSKFDWSMLIVYLIMVDISSCEDKVMIWIQHPGVESFFRYLGDQSGFYSSIKTLTNVDKEKLCKAIITVFSVKSQVYESSTSPTTNTSSHFPLTSRYTISKILHPVIYPEKFKSMEFYPKNLADASGDYTEVSVNVEGEIMAVDVLPCITYKGYTWYVASYIPEIYFTIESGPGDGIFTLTGILEPPPRPIKYCCDSKEKLETQFLKGQSKVAGKRTSLCKLNAFNKFRLCTTVFVTWLDQRHELGSSWTRVNDFVDDNKTCKQTVYLTSNNKHRQLGGPPVDLLACAVDNLRFKPDFFVTADESNPKSIFIVSAVEDKDSGTTKYILKMHFTDIYALTNAMNDNLMVDTLKEGPLL